MKQFECKSISLLDRHVPVDFNEVELDKLYPAWEDEFKKMMGLFKVDKDGMIALFEKYGVKPGDVVEEDFERTGVTPYMGVLIKERVAMAEFTERDGKRNGKVSHPVDLFAIPNQYGSVVSRKIFQAEVNERLGLMDRPELVSVSVSKEKVEVDMNTIDKLRKAGILDDKAYERIKDGEICDEVEKKTSLVYIYYQSYDKSTMFVKTSEGTGFVDIDSLLDGDILEAFGSEYVDLLYKSQYTYYNKDVKDGMEYKALVMGTKEMSAMMDVAHEYINKNFK